MKKKEVTETITTKEVQFSKLLRKSCNLAASIIFCFFFVAAGYAQNPVSWSLTAPKSVKTGAKLEARLTANISGGWYLYSLTQPTGGPNPTRVTVASESMFKLAGTVKAPAPKVKFDESFGINTESYSGNIVFTIPLQVANEAQAGKQAIDVSVRYQVCNETTCLPPKTFKVSAPVEILEAVATIAQTNPSPTPTPTPTPAPKVSLAVNSNTNVSANYNQNSNVAVESNNLAVTKDEPQPPTDSLLLNTANNFSDESAKTTNTNQAFLSSEQDDLWSFIWVALSLGALSLLTPCVFPMIPITVSYFTNHSAGDRSKAVKLASVYSIGIIATFTLLGMLLAIFVGAAGINLFAANPWVNLLIAGIFLFFAFNLFGAYEITVPSGVLTRLDSLTRSKEGEGGGIVGALLMGLTFTLTSFTCTSPFVGTILVSASQGSWQMPLLGMLAFSAVFALPFFVLALVPQWVSQLPRAGGWMNSVKVSMGFLEVAAAMKFISNVDLVWKWGIFTRPLVLAIWIALGILLSVYLLGKYQLFHDSKTERIGALRLVSAVVSLAISFYLLTGLFGARLGELDSFLPPMTENTTTFAKGGGEKTGEVEWIKNDYNGALEKARRENKAVFVDFTGYTCTNCRWMEANMFPKPAIRRELEKYVLVQLYTDGEGEPYQSLQQMQEEKFKTVALPFYAVLDANGNEINTFPGLTRKEEVFVSFLQAGHTKFLASNGKLRSAE